MRAYFFGNMYLSSIQQGIQSAHCLAEMFIKYQYMDGLTDNESQKCTHLYNWANYHKTMILLNGGYSEALRTLAEFFDTRDNPYPWAKFHEGQDALDGALTCVGIILPERVYDNVELVVSASTSYSTLNTNETVDKLGLSPYDQFLCREISKYGLAR